VIGYENALIEYGRIEACMDVWQQADSLRVRFQAWNAVRLDQERTYGLMEIGRYAEAEKLLLETADRLRQMKRLQTVTYNRNLLLRAQLLNLTGRSDEALKTLSEYRAFPVSVQVSRMKLEEVLLRSEILLQKDDVRSAINLAAEAQRAIMSTPNSSYLALWEARAALIEGKARRQSGEGRRALPLLERAVALRSQILDTSASPALGDAQVALANCYLDLHNRKEASLLLARAKAILGQHVALGDQYRKPMIELERRMHHPVPATEDGPGAAHSAQALYTWSDVSAANPFAARLYRPSPVCLLSQSENCGSQ
jgi:tetratricopeptide (TPR) repeat protein